MSKKYKEAMDKIVLSDELKTKIIENSVKKSSSCERKNKTYKNFLFSVWCSLCCLFIVVFSGRFC